MTEERPTGRLSLADEAELREGSGLSAETILTAGLRSISRQEASSELGYGVGSGGLLFPYPSVNAQQPSYARVKLHEPGPDGKRYRAPMGTGNRLYLPAVRDWAAVMRDAAVPVVATEGEKKTLAGNQAGLVCFGLSGVDCWRTRDESGRSRPLPEFDLFTWPGRSLLIVFDSDLVEKAQVAAAERALALELARRGAHVSGVRLPPGPDGEKQGLDDFLLMHAATEVLWLPRVLLAAGRLGPVLPLGVPGGVFVATSDPPLEPLIETLWPAPGHGVLGGEEKLGKSYYMLYEALCLALGTPVFGRFPVPRPRRVLILEEEDSERRTRRRLRALLRGLGHDPDDASVQDLLSERLQVSVLARVRLDDPAGRERLEETCRLFSPEVVYPDALRKFSTRYLGAPEAMKALLDVMDELGATHGFSWRGVHHYRRQQGPRTGRGSQEIIGGFEMGAWLESSLFFEPLGRSHRARLTVQSKDAQSDLALLLTWETEGPHHDPTSVRFTAEEESHESRAEQARARLLATLRSLPSEAPASGSPGVSASSLAHALRLTARSVKTHLRDLKALGLVEEVGKLLSRAKLYAVSDKPPEKSNG